jgi:hypothetical protein
MNTILRKVWYTGAGVVSLLFASSCDFEENKKFAQQAFQEFHSKLDAGAYDQLYREADPEFRKSVTEADFARLLESVRIRLGKPQRSTIRSYLEGAFPDWGLMARVTYDVQFERGQAKCGFGNDGSPTVSDHRARIPKA